MFKINQNTRSELPKSSNSKSNFSKDSRFCATVRCCTHIKVCNFKLQMHTMIVRDIEIVLFERLFTML